MIRIPVLLILLLGIALWFVGCSDKATETNTSQTNPNSEFGGYTATPEEPGFGDPDLLGSTTEEEEYNDRIISASALDSLIADPNAGFYHFRAVWGQLTYDSSVTVPTDWTGSLTISRGVEVVRRVIAFERRTDTLLERTDRRVIEWVSQTTVAYDGIAVDMFFPHSGMLIDTTLFPKVDTLGETTWVSIIDTILPEPVEVTFATGPYTRTFTLPELETLDTIVYLEDSNAVAFHAFKLDRIPCARGFLAGKWGFDEEGNGVFRGMWMSRHGFIDGWLQGTWTRDDSLGHVFYGKWIDRSGQFEGFLRGRWKPHPNRHASDEAFRHAGGWFAGKIYNSEEIEIGALRGKYKSAEHPEKPGYFQGLWRLYCGGSSDHAWDDDCDDSFGHRDDNDNDYEGGGDD